MEEETRSWVRDDFSRGEQVTGLSWLALGALISVLLEVVYLGTWIGGVPVPYTILIAFLFNLVLTRTARLWTDNPAVALIPLAAWTLGFFVLMFGVEITGDILMGNNVRTLLLLFSGIIGGVVPVFKGK